MSKKDEFIKLVDTLLENVSVDDEYKGALEYYEIFKNDSDTVKPAFTENGAKVLKYCQENKDTHNNMFKAKEIGEGLGISSRGASGAMRKLVTDGYVEKLGKDPVVYALTDKGIEVDVDAALA